MFLKNSIIGFIYATSIMIIGASAHLRWWTGFGIWLAGFGLAGIILGALNE